jgi:hypothetical protein
LKPITPTQAETTNAASASGRATPRKDINVEHATNAIIADIAVMKVKKPIPTLFEERNPTQPKKMIIGFHV